MIGLKFLLRYGTFFQVLTTEDRAKEIIKSFGNGTYQSKGVHCISEDFGNQGGYSVSVSDIMAIHTVPVETTQTTYPSTVTVPTSPPYNPIPKFGNVPGKI